MKIGEIIKLKVYLHQTLNDNVIC